MIHRATDKQQTEELRIAEVRAQVGIPDGRNLLAPGETLIIHGGGHLTRLSDGRFKYLERGTITYPDACQAGTLILECSDFGKTAGKRGYIFEDVRV